jgi:protein-tyrosine phosphatase
MSEPRRFSILFCCMGNICRSPTAEGVLRHVLSTRAAHLQIEVDSAGTHDYHLGEAPDVRAMQAARRRGIDLSSLRARQVLVRDFEQFDLVIAMDEHNLDHLQRMAPVHRHDRIKLMMEYAPDLGTRNVPDPYYGPAQGFEEVLDLLQAASEGLLADLLSRLR